MDFSKEICIINANTLTDRPNRAHFFISEDCLVQFLDSITLDTRWTTAELMLLLANQALDSNYGNIITTNKIINYYQEQIKVNE